MKGLWVRSPWWGVLEIVEPPSEHTGTQCWNGEEIADYVTETLRPLTPEAAQILGVPFGDRVWNKKTVQQWEDEPINWP